MRKFKDYNSNMHKNRVFWFLRLLVVAYLVAGFVFLPRQPVLAQSGQDSALVLTLNGELTQTMADYLIRGLALAKQNNDEMVIVQIDTPGGSIDLMETMEEAILASPVPVIVYVYPNGGMAGSAGTIITLSGGLVAMAPRTIIGAASPVGSGGTDLGATEQAKVTNAMVALVQSLTAHRPPAAQALAADMIQTAKAVSAYDAQKAGLADFIANDLNDLLLQLNGVKVTTPTGEHTLQTINLNVQTYSISFVEQLLNVVINANIVFLLLTVGVQALLIELANPGGWIPGFIGVVSLALAGYGLGILPVNWFGIVFIVIAFVLFILDIKTPTHGALTAAGVVSFIIGGLVLFNSTNVPSTQRVSTPLVIGTGVVMGAIFFTIVGIAVRAQRRPIRMGPPNLVGKTGLAHSDINPRGSVQIAGEMWTAELMDGEPAIIQGTPVVVAEMKSLHVKVRRAG
jgi:membrane-bound serine protease (ClpP class)